MTGAKPWSTTQRLSVLGTGWAAPGEPVTSEALITRMVETFGFTGVRQARFLAGQLAVAQRHICRALLTADEPPLDGQSNPDLAARAVAAALTEAGLRTGDLTYLIAHTATPAQELPSNAATVADLLGYEGPYVELRQACTGFGNALMIAGGLIASTPGCRVAIVGSETGSRFFDPAQLHDAGQIVNLMQMGDGAGAIVLGGDVGKHPAITASWFGGIGLNRAPGISRASAAGHFEHDFATIRATGHQLFDAGAEAAANLGCSIFDADKIIPHQVSGRIGEQAAEHFGLALSRMVVTADRYGNTGSAAIWLTLAQLREAGLTPGARVLALGAEASKHFHAGFVYEHA